MNSKINNNEYKQSNENFSGEGQQRILYDQLRVWAQKKGELKKQNAKINAEFREFCNYALFNGIDLTRYQFPEGKFVMKERHSPVTRELLLKHCDGLVSPEILKILIQRIEEREVRHYRIFELRRKHQTANLEKLK